MPDKPIDHMKMLGAETPDDVYRMVGSWSSDLTEREHRVRSVILDIHLEIEKQMKQIMYHYNHQLLFLMGDETRDKEQEENLSKAIEKQNWASVYRYFQPIFKSWCWAKPDLEGIEEINKLRNAVAHTSDTSDIQYRGKNPFEDAETFAQLFLEAWAIRKELREFYMKAIADPKARAEHYEAEFKKREGKQG